MESIKNNLGFLIFVVVGAILALALGFAWIRTIERTIATEKSVQDQEKIIDQSQRGAFALSPDNLARARTNRDVTDQAFRDFLGKLVDRYGIPIEASTGLDCVRVLKEACRNMERELRDPAKDITLSQEAAKFSFESILSSSSIPSADDVPVILKHMRIVQEVVKVASTSRLREFQRISRPQGLRAINKDLYSIVPLEVSIAGGYKAIQGFVNALQQREALGIFILRSVELTSQDEVGANGSIAAMDAMSPVAAPVRGGPGPGELGRRPPLGSPLLGMPKSATVAPAATAVVEPQGPTLIPLEKDQRVVFAPHELQARILVDFIEFKKPAEEK